MQLAIHIGLNRQFTYCLQLSACIITLSLKTTTHTILSSWYHKGWWKIGFRLMSLIWCRKDAMECSSVNTSEWLVEITSGALTSMTSGNTYKVTKYTKSKGWVTSADAYFFSRIKQENETPNVFHAATTTAPVFEKNTLQQLAAAMLQQMQINAAQNDVIKN
ncbi:hypothetical protein Moror_12112 [Moniliophthora roreri MCA 2997]|uniref:Uncharacterized protein n=1 Tax=Moniliophthora roreri (strain MCA 2997) TaxID=1381753 RepID=V2WIB6_MONRO|nr:hypothetical protein Moror_12112 [Moniliophthora roreri MCA 2997]